MITFEISSEKISESNGLFLKFRQISQYLFCHKIRYTSYLIIFSKRHNLLCHNPSFLHKNDVRRCSPDDKDTIL